MGFSLNRAFTSVRHVGWLVFFSWLLLICFDKTARAAKPCTDPAKCRGQLTLSTGKKIPYYRNYPLNKSNSNITRAVIVIHGLGRTADNYFRYVVNAAQTEGKLESTLIIAPKFQIRADKRARNEHYWTGQWSRGDPSVNAPRLSSFTVVDEIYKKITSEGKRRKTFKNLKSIALAGHSAGGQFVNRYVAGGRGTKDRKVKMRFLVMNPSSYLYIDPRRPSRNSSRRFEIPLPFPRGYDAYKYGLHVLNPYMLRRGIPAIVLNMTKRKAYYLAGMKDTGTKDLDTRPAARIQGKNRYHRWKNYRAYVRLHGTWRRYSSFQRVSGVGHSGNKMFNSAQARQILFGS